LVHLACPVAVVVEGSKKKDCNLLEGQLALGDWPVREHNWVVVLVVGAVAAVGMIVAARIELHCWSIRMNRNFH
jgi:hypothetical protein